MIVGAAIADHAKARPDRAALVFDGQQISWQALETMCRRAASWIQAKDPDGLSVALHLPNCPALVVLFLASIRLGREAQILDTQWAPAQTRDLVRRLKASLVISEDMIDAEAVMVSKDALDCEGMSDWQNNIDSLADWPDVDPETPFYVGFTSGSTGVPKGYRRNHQSWIRSFEAAQEEFTLTAEDVVIAPGTLTHSLHLFALAYALHEGACCVLMRSFKPSAVTEAIREQNATILFGVPAQLGLISRYLGEKTVDAYRTLRWLISSGSKWSSREDPVLRGTFPDALFAEFYGASETSFITIAKDGEPVPEGSVGRPFSNVDVRIRDMEGNCIDPGAAGRIFVRSDMMFDGYATGTGELACAPDGAMCVGDIGYMDECGYLFLTGRENRMIVTSGKNLFPEEVENILAAHPHVECAAILGVEDARRGEKLLAILYTRASAILTRKEIIAYARGQLPLFKVPRNYLVARDWPMTRSGKTDFAALREMVAAGVLEKLE